MDNERICQRVGLGNGRFLAYTEYGPPTGTHIFYFHGFPSSRLDWQIFNNENALKELNIRIIAPDRPGYSLSDFVRNRKMIDWSQDVIVLADALHIDKFSVLGISGGGPYAATCAFGIRDRLLNTGIVCGMGPSNAPGMKDGVSWSLPGSPGVIRRIIFWLTALGFRKHHP